MSEDEKEFKGPEPLREEITNTDLELIALEMERVKNDPNYTAEEKKEYIETLNIQKSKALGLIK